MNLTPGQAHEAYIGPPSELVDVAEFLQPTTTEATEDVAELTQSAAALPSEARAEWDALDPAEKEKVREECWYVSYALFSYSSFRLLHFLHSPPRNSRVEPSAV